MSGVSLPVNRPTGRALVVGSTSHREQPVEILQRLCSFECTAVEDPYHAMRELCAHRSEYQALILSLASLYREELSLITTAKRRFPHLEIWLAHTDARPALLAEAVRFGADGLLAEDGLHRIAATGAPCETPTAPVVPEPTAEQIEPDGVESVPGEPVLTSEELRALLQDQPSMPPSGTPD